MIYWHVEKHSTCIYSQLRRCSSSEVAAMIEGVLRHCTDMTVDRQYVDSHGQSEVAFAFSYYFFVTSNSVVPCIVKMSRSFWFQSSDFDNRIPVRPDGDLLDRNTSKRRATVSSGRNG
jgi:hypothetical protein